MSLAQRLNELAQANSDGLLRYVSNAPGVVMASVAKYGLVTDTISPLATMNTVY